jgi:hypothetical protein
MQAGQPALASPATALAAAQPQQMGQPQAQPSTPLGTVLPSPVVPVAAQPGVPVIIWGTPIGHGDRGPCTNCHGVIMPQGMPVPAISALSVMPHAYRGVCNNCHEVKVMPLGAPVAGVITVPPQGAMAGNPPKRAPTEPEWLGLEVGVAAQGVLVNGVEGMAKRAGMRVGDVIASINAVPVDTVADFVAVTQNGGLTQGAVIARREGQRLAFELGPRAGQQRMQMEQGQMQPRMQMEQGQVQPRMQMDPGPQMRGAQIEDQRGRQIEQNQDQQGMRMQQGIPIQGAMQGGMQGMQGGMQGMQGGTQVAQPGTPQAPF